MDDHTRDSTTTVWTMLDRYLAGEASAEEASTIQAMLARIPDAETILRLERRASSGNVRRLQALTSSDWANEGIAERWNAIVSQLALEDTTEFRSISQPEQQSLTHGSPALKPLSEPLTTAKTHSPNTVFSLSPSRKLWRASLAGAMGIGIAMLGWFGGAGHVRKDLSTHVSTYATPAGKQATVTLPDGTEMLLNVGSKIQVPGDFMNGNRSVRLVGEALFTVIHHTAEPFVVVTNDVSTKVLGTQFAVRAYPDDSITTVAVKEGKVAVDNVVVASGEQVRIAGKRSNNRIVIPAQASRQNFVFTEGIVAFDDVRLADAVQELSRWYDARILFSDESLKELRISGEFSAKSIADLIEVLEGTFKVKAVRSGNAITISKR